MTDFYRFINSKAIREHFIKINYEMSPLLSAYFVYNSDHNTLEEKHEAYREIIETTEDFDVPENFMADYVPSFHKFLEEVIDFDNALVNELMMPDKKYIYYYKIKTIYDSDGDQSEFIFGDYKSCLSEALQEYGEDAEYFKSNSLEIPNSIEIIKESVYSTNAKNKLGAESVFYAPTKIIAELNKNGEIISIELDNYNSKFNGKDEDEIDNFFFMRYFDVPLPFEKGDIVCNRHERSKPLVLGNLYNEKQEWEDDKQFESRMEENNKLGAEDDMRYQAYACNRYMQIMELDHTDYVDSWGWLDLDYYDGELEGVNRMLIPISKYIKGRIDLDLLINSILVTKTKIESEKCRGAMKDLIDSVCKI